VAYEFAAESPLHRSSTCLGSGCENVCPCTRCSRRGSGSGRGRGSGSVLDAAVVVVVVVGSVEI
jgi:hypothetical protein